MVLVYESNCLYEGSETKGGMSSVGKVVFLRDRSPYLRSFRENHEKLWRARSTSMSGDWIWHLLPTNFNYRTALPLEGQIRMRTFLKSPNCIFKQIFLESHISLYPFLHNYFKRDALQNMMKLYIVRKKRFRK